MDTFAYQVQHLVTACKKPGASEKDNKKWLLKALVGFFLFMLVFTVISRAMDSIMIPKVQIGNSTPGNLEYSTQGKGVVKAGEVSNVDIPKGYKIERVLSTGTAVEAGQGIVFLKLTDLKEQKEIKEAELKKLELSLDAEALSREPLAKTSEQEAASGNLELARRSYEEAQQKVQQAQEDYNAAMNQKNKESADARAEAQARLNQSLMAGEEQAVQEYDAAISQIEEELNSFEEAQRSNYDAAVEVMNGLRNSLEQAQNAMDLARKNDANSRINDQKAQDISDKNQESIQVDIDTKKTELSKIDNLIESNGEIRAESSGVIAKMSIEAGSTTTGEECVELGNGQYQFIGELSREDTEKIKEGDKIDIMLAGENYEKTGRVASITIDPGKENDGISSQEQDPEQTIYASFTVDLEEGSYRLGSSGSYTIKVSSDVKYQNVVPLSAIRQDVVTNKYYCLVVEKKSTVLGEEEVAVCKYVEYIAADSNHAAVENISSEDQLIIGSNKEVKAGDRVRKE